MSSSLRDQLIKAGVVTQEQADKAVEQQRAEKQARRNRSRNDASRGGSGNSRGAGKGGRGQSGGKPDAGRRRGKRSAPGRGSTPVDDSPAAVQARAAAQALARDARAVKALRRAAEGSEKALRDELRRFIAGYDQRAREALESDEPYHFAHNKKVKRIHLPEGQIEALARGELVIVNNDGRYALLPFGPACAVASVDRRRIVAAHLTSDDEDSSAPTAE